MNKDGGTGCEEEEKEVCAGYEEENKEGCVVRKWVSRIAMDEEKKGVKEAVWTSNLDARE